MRDLAQASNRRQRVAARFDELLVAHPANVLWLTGGCGSGAYLWLKAGRWHLVVPEGTPDLPADVEVITYSAPMEDLRGQARKGWRTLASVVAGSPPVDTTDLPVGLWTELGLSAVKSREADLDDLRQVKDSDELALIERNVGVVCRGLESARDALRPGCRETEVWAALTASMSMQVGQDVEFHGLLGIGERTVEAAPRASARALRKGDSILLDAFPYISGYAADLTRTWFCGVPSKELARIYEAVHSSLRAVEQRLRPGAVASDLDAAARQVLAEAGLPAFPHQTGHGLGVMVQERPWLVPGSEDTLKPGMVIAVEPGCYVPAVGGVRLELDFLITEDGPRRLGEDLPDLEAAIRP